MGSVQDRLNAAKKLAETRDLNQTAPKAGSGTRSRLERAMELAKTRDANQVTAQTGAQTSFSTLSGVYGTLPGKNDWAEKSKAAGSKIVEQPWWKLGADRGDDLYDFINDINGYRATKAAMSRNSNIDAEFGDYTKYTGLMGDEVKAYNYLYATEGRESAQAFLNSLERQLSARQAQAGKAELERRAAADPVGTSILSVPASLIGGAISAADLLGQNIRRQDTGKAVDYHSDAQQAGAAAEIIRNKVSSDLEKNTTASVGGTNVASFLYNTLMSGADSMAAGLTAPTAGVAGLMLATGAGTATARDIVKRGGSDDQALVGAVAAGAFEALFERFSIGNFKAMQDVPVKTLEDLVKNTVKSMGVNASEEMATELANILFDTTVMGDVSNWENSVRYYMQQGMSEEQAKSQTVADLFGQVLEAGASGALMGAGFAGVGALSGRLNAKRRGNQEQNAQAAGTPLSQPTADSSPTRGEPSTQGMSESAAQQAEARAGQDVTHQVETTAEERETAAQEGTGDFASEVARQLQGEEITAENAAENVQTFGGLLNETAENGQIRENVSDGDGLRDDGARAGGEAGVLGEGTERAGERAAEQQRAAGDRQRLANDLRLNPVSSAELGLTRGTDARVTRVLPEEHWDEAMRQTAKRVQQETGKTVTFVVGAIQVRDQAGKIHRVRGVFSGDGIIVQADHMRYTIDQIADHEIYHDRADAHPELNERIRERIAQEYTREELAQVLEGYVKGLRGLIDIPVGASQEQKRAAMMAILEEVYADAYAGMNAFGANAGRFGSTVKQVMTEQRVGRGRETAQATERTTGPPERFSYAGRNALRANEGAREEAERLEMQGADPETIRQQTGWFRGADRQWRWEIDDSGMEYDKDGNLEGAVTRRWAMDDMDAAWEDMVEAITPEQLERVRKYLRATLDHDWERAEQMYQPLAQELGQPFTAWVEAREWAMENRDKSTGGKLSDYIKHPELFANYPQLRNATLRFERMEDGTRGRYEPYTGTIIINEAMKDAPEKTLIHEVQHAIQHAEGFATGASTEYWEEVQEGSTPVRSNDRKISDTRSRMEQTLSEVPENVAEQFRQFSRLEQNDNAAAMRLAEELGNSPWSEQFNQYFMDSWTLEELEKYNHRRGANDLYRNTAGEIEARDTAGRLHYSEQQRRETRPDTGDERTVFADRGTVDYAAEKDSIKDQLRGHQQELEHMEPVAIIQAPEGVRSWNMNQTRRWVEEKLRPTGYQVDRNGFGVIVFDEKRLNTSLDYLQPGGAEVAAYAALPRVLKRGVEISGHENHKGREYGTVTIAAPVILNGKRGNMAVVVKRTSKNFYKMHRILAPDGTLFVLSDEMNNAELTSGGGVTENGSLATPISSASESSLRSEKQNVNVEIHDATEGLSLPRPEPVERYSISAPDAGRMDGAYMEAVEQGDMETAQRMVASVARERGYTPVKRYHQTFGGFTRFSTANPRAGLNDSETPNGIFFKENDHDIGLEGKVQMQAYLKADNMLHFRNREEANKWYCDNVEGYAPLQSEYNSALKPFLDELDEIEKKMFDPATTDDEYSSLDEREEAIIEEMRVVEDSYRERLRELLNGHFLNGTSGYDGIELDYDGHRWVNGKRENVHTYIVFDPAQAKSAEPVTYDDSGEVIPLSRRFDESTTDIRYSVEDDADQTEAQPEEKPKKKTKPKQTKPPQKSLPTIAKQDLKQNLLNLFSIPEGQRAELGAVIDHYAEVMLKEGSLTQKVRDAFFDRMYAAGVVTVKADPYYQAGRSAVAGGRVYVNEQIKGDFGDDWNDFRKRAFAAGVYLTNDKTHVGVDVWNQELSEILPGMFDREELDGRTVLERIVQAAEEGKDEKMSLADYTAMMAHQQRITQDEQLDGIERQMDWALRTFAEKAKLEVKLRDRTGVKLAQMRADHKEAAERQRADRELRELQQKTLKQLQWLSKNRNRATAEVKATWDEVLGDIDLFAVGAANEMRWSDKYNATWRDIAQMYKDAQKNDPNFLPSKELERIVSRLDDKKIGEMDLDALQVLYRAAIALRQEFYNRNNVIGDMEHRLFEEVFEQSKSEIEGQGGKFSGKALDKLFNLEQLTPMNVMQRMVGWDPKSTWFSMAKQIEKGERDIRGYTVEANRYLQQFLTEHEDWVKKADGQGDDAVWYEVEVPELLELHMGDKPIFGATKTVYMTPAQKVHLYLESKSEDNLRHMTGGRTFVDRELYSQGKRKEAMAQGTTIRLAPETVKKLTSDLTQEEMELARLLENYYNDFAKGRINRVSNILYGYDKAISKNYAPIYTNSNYTKSEIGIFDATAEGVGNLKARQVSKNPSYNLSCFDAFERHVDQTARFVGMSIPARNWQTLLNWRVKNNSMADILTHKWGEESKKYITDLLEDLQGGKMLERDTISSSADKIFSKYISAVFGANPSIVLKQMGSIPLASAYLDMRNIPSVAQLRGIDRGLIAKYSQELDYRTMGYSMPETKILKENPGRMQSNKFLNFTFGGGAITAMDGWAASTLWPWAENKVRRDFPELELGTQEQIETGKSPFYQKVAELFDEAVTHTQSVSDITHQSVLRKSRNPITRAFTMFKSDAAQGYNVLRQKIGEAQFYEKSGADEETVRKAKRDVGGAFLSVLAGYSYAQAITFLIALWKNRGKKYRDDEDELTVGSVLQEIAFGVVSDLTGMVVLGQELAEVIGNVLTGEKWYGIDTPGGEQLNDLLETAMESFKGVRGFVADMTDVVLQGGSPLEYIRRHGNDYLGGIKDAAATIATYGPGLPVNNLEAYLLGLVRWVSPEIATAYDDLMATANKSGLSGLKGDALTVRVRNILENRAGNVKKETAQALAELYEAGYTKAVPSETPGTISVGKEGDREELKLDAYQQQLYDMAWRAAIGGELDDLVASEEFREAETELQEKMLNRLYEYAREKGRSAVSERYEMESAAKKADAVMAAGATAAQWFALSASMADQKREEQYDMIVQSDLPEDAVVAAMGTVMGTDMKTESGEPSQYAKLLEVIRSGASADEWLELRRADAVDDYLGHIGAGIQSGTALRIIRQIEKVSNRAGEDVEKVVLWRAAVNAAGTQREQMAVMESLMTDSEYQKLSVGVNQGVTPEQYVEVRERLLEIDTNGSVDQKEAARAVAAMSGLSLEQKAILWQMQSKSWGAKNNPFSPGVGARVKQAMENAAEANDEPGWISLPKPGE